MKHPKPPDSFLRQNFLRQLQKLWPAIKGSLAQVRKPCIRPNCPACARDDKHPAFILSFTDKGRRRCMYVPAELVPQGKGVVSMTTFVRHIPIVLAVVLILQFCAPPAVAQYNAGLQGTVTDPNGGVIPEATVKLTSQETGFVHTVTTTGEGVYSITGLAPGKYSLSVEKAGFSKKVFSEVVIGAEAMQAVNVG